MKKCILLGIFLILLAGCQMGQPAVQPEASEPPAASLTEAETPASSALTEREKPITPEDLLLRDYIAVYEKYCRGVEFSGETAPEFPVYQNYLLGWLEENPDNSRYAVYNGSKVDYFSIPRQEAETLARLVFGREVVFEGDLRSEDGWAEKSASEVQIELTGYQKLDNGNYRLTVSRKVSGGKWYPGEYEFAPANTIELPDTLQDGFSVHGAYRFVSVKNLPLEGKKSGGDMISIHSPEDLLKLAELVNSGDAAYQENVYQLTSDLDMSGIDFVPIGTYAPGDSRDPAPNGFSTTFDGRGHTIRNLKVQAMWGPAGLFSRIGAGGFVTNLKLENCDISASTGNYTGEAGAPAGAVVGGLIGGAVSRCEVLSGKVSGGRAVGGLVGLASDGNIQESSSNAAVTGNCRVGGAVGHSQKATLLECTVTGEVNAVEINGLAVEKAGGLIGENSEGTLDRCIVSAQITAESGTAIGAFVGENGGRLIGCFYDTDRLDGREAVGISIGGPVRGEELIGLSRKELEDMDAFHSFGG